MKEQQSRQIGDKVKIKSLEWCEKHKYKIIGMAGPMKKHCGEIMTISRVIKPISDTNDKFYHLEEDPKGWYWSEKMFENNL